MIKGGYKIIDLKNTPLEVGGDAVTIEGIHDSIKDSYRKPLLVTGLVIDGSECNDVFVTPMLESSNYVLTAYGKNIVITDIDSVTLIDPDPIIDEEV